MSSTYLDGMRTWVNVGQLAAVEGPANPTRPLLHRKASMQAHRANRVSRVACMEERSFRPTNGTGQYETIYCQGILVLRSEGAFPQPLHAVNLRGGRMSRHHIFGLA